VSIKIALPKGRLLAETASRLQLADLGLAGYYPKTRLYRLTSERYPDLFAKIFHAKDIPIQVAVGNYDLGICGLDWVEELLAKYPSSALVKISDLGYGEGRLYMMTSRAGGAPGLKDAPAKINNIRIASEYPNLAEAFALSSRLRRFSIFPLWGGAEVYPPENAEMALVSRRKGEPLNNDLVPLSEIMGFSTFLIANRLS
jgi:ATP phosphoribosyltransferase